jgi:hypothetical protein
MIEVSDDWLERKRKEAKGELPLTKDPLLDVIASGDLAAFYKLPGRWRTLVGYHNEARRRAAALKAEAQSAPGPSA